MLVYIRRIHDYESEEELKNIKLLHSGSMRASPNNHCTPVLDLITLDHNIFVVTPILAVVTEEMFHRVDDVLGFIGQILLVCMESARHAKPISYDQWYSCSCLSQGIQYMHAKDIAHR